jgi:hypothetical protein
LVGRLDISGAEKIDAPLKETADSKTNIVVDMSGVDFIASLGMRSLVIAAKTLARNSRILVSIRHRWCRCPNQGRSRAHAADGPQRRRSTGRAEPVCR